MNKLVMDPLELLASVAGYPDRGTSRASSVMFRNSVNGKPKLLQILEREAVSAMKMVTLMPPR